jgi:flavin reductase (DIM6/NTAB) family NADH-FMN oxidoreductase RutF
MFYDPRLNNHGLPNDPFKAVVVPRPIGWISTLSAEGVPNLAPYSFFNAVSEHPHYVAFGSDGMKDSLRNIESTGEFAVNLVTHDLREKMNMTSAMVGSHIDEFELADLSKVPCQLSRLRAWAKALCVLNAATARRLLCLTMKGGLGLGWSWAA